MQIETTGKATQSKARRNLRLFALSTAATAAVVLAYLFGVYSVEAGTASSRHFGATAVDLIWRDMKALSRDTSGDALSLAARRLTKDAPSLSQAR